MKAGIAILLLMIGSPQTRTEVGGRTGNPSAPVAAEVLHRQEALRIATRNIVSAGPEFLPLVEKGLEDSDARVRFLALSALSQLIMNVSNDRLGKAPRVDPRNRPTLQTILVRSLDDPDYLMRAGSARMLISVTSPMTAPIRSALIVRLKREPDSGVRTTIVNFLGRNDPRSPEVQQMLVEAIKDVDPGVWRAAAGPLVLSTPDAALPGVVALIVSGPLEVRRDFVGVLGNYGARARPHLQLLETLLKNETSERNRNEIRHAIAMIENSPN